MTFFEIVGLVVAFAIFAYLVFALFEPEKID